MSIERASYSAGIITVTAKKKTTSSYRKYLNKLLENHFGKKGLTILKDTDEKGTTTWVIGTDKSIGELVDKSLGVI